MKNIQSAADRLGAIAFEEWQEELSSMFDKVAVSARTEDSLEADRSTAVEVEQFALAIESELKSRKVIPHRGACFIKPIFYDWRRNFYLAAHRSRS